jgi:hypothetical protein
MRVSRVDDKNQERIMKQFRASTQGNLGFRLFNIAEKNPNLKDLPQSKANNSLI